MKNIALTIALIAGSAISANALATEAPDFTIRADVANSYSNNEIRPATPDFSDLPQHIQTWTTDNE